MKIARKTMLALQYVMETYLDKQQVKDILQIAVDAAPYILTQSGDLNDDAIRHLANLYKSYINISQEE